MATETRSLYFRRFIEVNTNAGLEMPFPVLRVKQPILTDMLCLPGLDPERGCIRDVAQDTPAALNAELAHLRTLLGPTWSLVYAGLPPCRRMACQAGVAIRIVKIAWNA